MTTSVHVSENTTPLNSVYNFFTLALFDTIDKAQEQKSITLWEITILLWPHQILQVPKSTPFCCLICNMDYKDFTKNNMFLLVNSSTMSLSPDFASEFEEYWANVDIDLDEVFLLLFLLFFFVFYGIKI